MSTRESAALMANDDEVRGTADCGECNRPEQFSWDSTYWVEGAPVIVCKTHMSLAPGWVYDLKDGVDADSWSRDRPAPSGATVLADGQQEGSKR